MLIRVTPVLFYKNYKTDIDKFHANFFYSDFKINIAHYNSNYDSGKNGELLSFFDFLS